jgi:hypothetical protein
MDKTRVRTWVLAAIAMAGVLGWSTSVRSLESGAGAAVAMELQRFADEMQAAERNQIDVLSPDAYRKAEGYLESAAIAQEAQDRADSSNVLRLIEAGSIELATAKELSRLSRFHIGDVAAARKAAIAAGAPRFFGAEFDEADDHLRIVTAGIERNDLRAAVRSRGKLRLEYLDLQLKATLARSRAVGGLTGPQAVKQ